MVTLAIAAALWATPEARAGDDTDEDVDETITVYSDLFKRWDGTRWHIKTEIVFPTSMPFADDHNHAFSAEALQIRTILACDKDWKLTGKRWQVHCKIEDIGLEAVVARRTVPTGRVQDLLDIMDQKLTGADLQLQVLEDGRIEAVDLEGVSKRNSAEAALEESLRQILMRVTAGFDMRLRKFNDLRPGNWIEYTSKLMTLPSDTASQGTSMVGNKLSRMDGHIIVESQGKGVATVGEGDSTNTYTTKLASVAVYDDQNGYMTERVWAMNAKPTASSWVAGDSHYWHAGRIRQLKPDEKPDVGATTVISAPARPVAGLPEWVSIEDR
jgi:hypothetical protein